MAPARNSSSTMGLQKIFKISHDLFYKQKWPGILQLNAFLPQHQEEWQFSIQQHQLQNPCTGKGLSWPGWKSQLKKKRRKKKIRARDSTFSRRHRKFRARASDSATLCTTWVSLGVIPTHNKNSNITVFLSNGRGGGRHFVFQWGYSPFLKLVHISNA